MIKFNFIKDYDEVKEKNKKEEYTYFYQLALYNHPRYHNHHLRMFLIDKDNNLVNYRNLYLNNEGFNEFLRNIPKNKYKLYSTYSLDAMPYPSYADILISKSSILN